MKRSSIAISAAAALLFFAFGKSRLSARPSGIEASKRSSFVILPVAFYTPETRLAGGAGGLFAFRLGGGSDSDRPSSVPFIAYYTQNRQFVFNVKPEIYVSGNAFFLSANMELSRYPDKFFGLGRDTPDSLEESYTPRQTSLELSFQRRIFLRPGIYAGLIYSYSRSTIMESKPGGLLAGSDIPGSRGGKISGAGLVLKWDSRDNIFFPRKGNLFQLSAVRSGRLFGSDFDYTKFVADLRSFWPVWRSHALALQAFLHAASGTVPFMDLPKLGGESVMRGYYSGRYRDKVFTALQVEYRMPVWWRFGLAGFAAVGDVADSIGNLKIGSFKWSAGLGIRFKVVPSEGMNVRLDFGFGKGVFGFYFMAGEAF